MISSSSSAPSPMSSFTLFPKCEYTVMQQPLGSGTYSTVFSAIHMPSSKKVAIKKIKDSVLDELYSIKQVLREIKLLRFLKGLHPCIVSFDRTLCLPPAAHTLINGYNLVLEHCDSDLLNIIYSKNILTDEHVQYFIGQLISAVYFLHLHKIVHRDLKPNNVLVFKNCEIRLADFGAARIIDYGDSRFDPDADLTQYVVTRWYRAPELIFSIAHGTACDMWSIGCILAELITRKPLFPGRSPSDQIAHYFEVLGTPQSEEDYAWIKNKHALQEVRKWPIKAGVGLRKMPRFKGASEGAMDLLEKLLVLDPSKRITAEQALSHPYLKDLACVEKSFFTPSMDSEKAGIYKELQDLEYTPAFLNSSTVSTEAKTNFVRGLVEAEFKKDARPARLLLSPSASSNSAVSQQQKIVRDDNNPGDAKKPKLREGSSAGSGVDSESKDDLEESVVENGDKLTGPRL